MAIKLSHRSAEKGLDLTHIYLLTDMPINQFLSLTRDPTFLKRKRDM